MTTPKLSVLYIFTVIVLIGCNDPVIRLVTSIEAYGNSSGLDLKRYDSLSHVIDSLRRINITDTTYRNLQDTLDLRLNLKVESFVDSLQKDTLFKNTMLPEEIERLKKYKSLNPNLITELENYNKISNINRKISLELPIVEYPIKLGVVDSLIKSTNSKLHKQYLKPYQQELSTIIDEKNAISKTLEKANNYVKLHKKQAAIYELKRMKDSCKYEYHRKLIDIKLDAIW